MAQTSLPNLLYLTKISANPVNDLRRCSIQVARELISAACALYKCRNGANGRLDNCRFLMLISEVRSIDGADR